LKSPKIWAWLKSVPRLAIANAAPPAIRPVSRIFCPFDVRHRALRNEQHQHNDRNRDSAPINADLVAGLRWVLENQQGLTPARRRGVRERRAPWIAFVDDDNLLEPGWLRAIAKAIRTHPQAGAIGGRVVLDWEPPPPDFIRRFGFSFAEQEPGDTACEMGSLVGAGMVVRRGALAKCGWLERTAA
jgi:glycosyltransferase involved in cell wall biosynthesis